MQIHYLGNFKNCYSLSIVKFSIYLVLYFESNIVKSVFNNCENLLKQGKPVEAQLI